MRKYAGKTVYLGISLLCEVIGPKVGDWTANPAIFGRNRVGFPALLRLKMAEIERSLFHKGSSVFASYLRFGPAFFICQRRGGVAGFGFGCPCEGARAFQRWDEPQGMRPKIYPTGWDSPRF